MSEPKARRRGRGERRAPLDQTLPQLPFEQQRMRYRPIEPLSVEQLEDVHAASLKLLQEIGVEVMSAEARSLFAKAGARVDAESGAVRMDPDMVMELVGAAPSQFRLTPQNPDHALHFGGDWMVFSLVGGPPNVHDAEAGRRPGNWEDYVRLTKLGQVFNAVQMLGNMVCSPIDLPANTRHLDAQLANLTLADKCFYITAIGRGRVVDGVEMAAIAKGVSVDALAEEPMALTTISVNSPRRFDDAMAEGLIAMVEYGQVPVITPFTLMGAMTPVTLGGALVQQNAEALFGVALTQLVKRGAPVMYGAFTSNVDLRSGAPAFGTPENTLANLASGQLARRYGLPYRSSNVNASTSVDAQAAYESLMGLWGAVLGGANLIYHGVGWLEGGLVASYEKIVLDVELIQHMVRTLQPIDTSAAALALDAQKDVPSGGHFFGEAHTMERFETAFYQPLLSDWRNHGAWEAAGSPDATNRATALWKRALDAYRPPAMDQSRVEALEAYAARRKEALGGEEP